MNRPLYTILTTLTLLILAQFTPLVAYSQPDLGTKLSQTPLKQVKPLKHAKLASHEPLQPAPYPYDPIGTHPNAFEYGSCTYGVASMKGNVTWTGNAKDWAVNASAQGKTVSDTPVAGSIAVDTGGTYGHVATVLSVGEGTVTVMEQNYDWNKGIRTYTYPSSKFVYIWV